MQMNTENNENINESSPFDILRLENQLCFSLYVCSKEIIRLYKPLLDPYELTYTGYIIMMALWEKDQITVKDLGKKLYLDSGTLTPMLKKLEALGYIERIRSSQDERNVFIRLTSKGNEFKNTALEFPKKMLCSLDMSANNATELTELLKRMMKHLDCN